jgi:hypothetical protein
MAHHGSTYLGRPYYPLWLDNLADDVTMEGAAMNGTVRGADAVHSMVVYAKTLYDYQDFSFAGPAGNNGFLEDYETEIRGKPTRVVVTVTRNAAGKAQSLVVNHRPRSSMLLMSRLMGEKFGGEHFLIGKPENVTTNPAGARPQSSSTRAAGQTSQGSIYLGRPYYPWWLDKLADDVRGEGAFMDGTAKGADAVRSIVVYAKTLYEFQDFSFAGPYGDNGFLEEYSTRIRGEPARVVVTVTRNAAGEAQQVVVNHRPRSSVLLLARLMDEKYTGSSMEQLFLAVRQRPRAA